MDSQPKVTIRIGWADLTDFMSVNTHRVVGMSDDRATVVVRADELRTPGVIYAGEVTIGAEHDGRTYAIFTGLVDRVDLNDDGTARVELAGLKRDFENTLMGGLVVGEGTDGKEIIFSLARQTDLPPDRINIEGWKPGPVESLLVVSPLVGLDVNGPRQIGDVLITNTNPARLDMADEGLVRQFASASAWASTIVEAETLMSAEEIGIERLRLAISLIRSYSFFSYPTLGGVLRPFDWRHTRARPELSPIVFVGSITSRRRWLRNIHDIEKVESLDLEDVVIPHASHLADGPPPKRLVHRALREWHLSVDAPDEVSRVAHLWRSMECYAAGVKIDRLFAPAQIRSLTDSVRSLVDWKPDQLARLEDALGRLNEAPLLSKLRNAMALDGVAITAEEFDALAATRALRNDLEHGRELSSAQHRVLDIATAVANRVLVTALIKLTTRPRPSAANHSDVST